MSENSKAGTFCGMRRSLTQRQIARVRPVSRSTSTRARALTPGCEEVLHLNHAGASLLPQPVLDAVVGHLQLEARTGGYEAAAEAAAGSCERTYAALAELIGAGPDEIALLDSASRAWDMAVYSLPIEPQDRVLIGRAEYGANAISLLQLQRRTGCQLVLDRGRRARPDRPRRRSSGRSPRTRRPWCRSSTCPPRAAS